MRAGTEGTSSSAGSPESRALTGRDSNARSWRGLPGSSPAAPPPPLSAHGVDGVRGSRVDQARSILRSGGRPACGPLRLQPLGQRTRGVHRPLGADRLGAQPRYAVYVWDGDTTGRIIVDRVMKAADRGVRVRLLIDDPYYKASDLVIAALDAHPDVEIRLFNPLTNRGSSTLDFILDFRRVNRRMHNKLMVADNAAAIVGERNIGDIYYGVNTIADYRDLDVLAVGPVVRDLSRVFDRYWNSPSTAPIAAIVDRTHGAADLDAILIRLREAIAAADYPYPIDQDLDELAGRGAELRDNRLDRMR